MGGGLFGTPVYLNPKCLLFSLAIIIVYFLPHPKTVAHNIVMIFCTASHSKHFSIMIIMAFFTMFLHCHILRKTIFFIPFRYWVVHNIKIQ